jgi:hypothetical protein
MVPAERTDLVAAGARFEISVVDIEFFDTEWTCIVYVVGVEYSIRLHLLIVLKAG